MAKAYWLPADEGGKLLWLSNFSSKLGTYAAPPLGVAAVEVNKVQTDYAFYAYVSDARNKFVQYAQDWTAYRNAARDGTALSALPTAPVLGAAPAMTTANIFGRATQLVGRMKKHPGYTEAIGQDLDIVGAELVAPSSTDVKPVLKLSLSAGQVRVGWKNQGMDGLELHVYRGDGKGFVFLAVDTVPDYVDTAPLPAVGTSAVWKYRAMYRQGDSLTGRWSDDAKITVSG